MKKRSISRLFLLGIITFGFYELVWLAQTRKEMVLRYKVKIPSFSFVAIIYAFQYLVGIVFLLLFFHAISINAKNASQPQVKPLYERLGEHCISPEVQNLPFEQQPAECQNAANQYFDDLDARAKEDNRIFYSLGEAYAILFAGLISIVFYVRWCMRYGAAVEYVTKGKVSKIRATNYLTLLPPTWRMIILQDAFNKT